VKPFFSDFEARSHARASFGGTAPGMIQFVGVPLHGYRSLMNCWNLGSRSSSEASDLWIAELEENARKLLTGRPSQLRVEVAKNGLWRLQGEKKAGRTCERLNVTLMLWSPESLKCRQEPTLAACPPQERSAVLHRGFGDVWRHLNQIASSYRKSQKFQLNHGQHSSCVFFLVVLADVFVCLIE
jgi:hypothetical protein